MWRPSFRAQIGIAEHPEGCEAGFFLAQAGSPVFGDLLLEVKTQLFIELCIRHPAKQEHADLHPELVQPALRLL